MASDLIEVVAARTIAAKPETVFAAWLDPVQAAKFLFATEHGTIVRAEIEPQVGGEFTIIDRREDEDIEHIGEWVEIAPPTRLVFDFSVNQSPVSRVRIDIAPEGAGSIVTLTHFMDAKWAAHAERARQGWIAVLDQLARALV